MSKQYESLKGDSRAYGERNDCTVIATAVVTGCGYKTAHSLLRGFGRRRRSGFRYYDNLDRILARFGLRANEETKEWRRRGARTMITFERLSSRGTFLVFTGGHVSAVVDGKVHDWAKGRKKRVQAVYRVAPR